MGGIPVPDLARVHRPHRREPPGSWRATRTSFPRQPPPPTFLASLPRRRQRAKRSQTSGRRCWLTAVPSARLATALQSNHRPSPQGFIKPNMAEMGVFTGNSAHSSGWYAMRLRTVLQLTYVCAQKEQGRHLRTERGQCSRFHQVQPHVPEEGGGGGARGGTWGALRTCGELNDTGLTTVDRVDYRWPGSDGGFLSGSGVGQGPSTSAAGSSLTTTKKRTGSRTRLRARTCSSTAPGAVKRGSMQSEGDVLIALAHLHGLRAHMGVRRTCR